MSVGMTVHQQLRFAISQLGREWKAGELSVLLLALVIAITSHTAIGHFTTRISSTMASNARDIIGGDLVLVANQPVDASFAENAKQLGLRIARAVHFSSVVSANDEILLVGVKAVDAGYPLKGSLKIATELYGRTQSVQTGPARGEAWVEARVMRTLNLQPGDFIQLGKTQFAVNRILTFEPDRGGRLYSFTPRVLINMYDLDKTGIVQPGSRVRYRYMFASTLPGAAQSLAEYRVWLEARLQPGQSVRGLDDERPGIAETLDKAQQYMGLAGLVALLLAAVAIAGSGRHYSERHYNTSALLRCLGCQQRDIVVIYLVQLLLLALAGGLIGNAIGWLAQAGLLAAISTLLPGTIAAPTWLTFYSGMALAFVVLIGFTLPSVLRLKSVSALRVLRNDLAPLPLSAQLVYGGSALLIAAMMWYYTGNLVLTAGLLGGAGVVLAVAALLIAALFHWLNALLPSMPVKIRAGMRNLVRRRRAATVQTMAFGLTIMAMLVVVFIRTELISDWQNAIPNDAANHFVLNIQKNQVAAYSDYLHAQQINGGKLYPVVRARLTHLNDKPMVANVSKEEPNDESSGESHDESLQRDLNLTWSANVPPDNEIIAGKWWSGDGDGDADGDADGGDSEIIAQASVESELAQRLNIKIGDRLTLFTGEQQWHAQVANIRRVQWDNFKPNFYLVFNPGALEHLPATWIHSFHLADTDKHKLANLVKNFTSITVLEVDAILTQVKSIIRQVTLAVEAILGFVLAAGIVVTIAAIRASMRERLHEGALLRTLGAERAQLRQNQWSEFAGLGFLSGIFGVLGAEIINALLYRRVFELDYTPVWWAWLTIPLLAAALIGLTGVMSSSRVLRQSPMESLRQWEAG